MIQILHRFGLLCFWASVAIAIAIAAFAVALVLDGSKTLGEAMIGVATSSGGYLAAGCAIRYVLGWRRANV